MADVLARFRLRARGLAFAALLLIVACGGGGGGGGPAKGTTEVLTWVAWGGNELKSYQDVVAPFEQSSGIRVHVETIREANVIANGVAAGTALPDIAAGPTDPQRFKSWVKKGVLKPMETALGDSFKDYIANTYPALTTTPGGASDDAYIGVSGGKHYMLMIKTQVKGFFWYNKHVYSGSAPKTYNDLLSISPSQYGAQKLFCAAFESGGDSGWPASDMMHTIVMRSAGDQVYTKWIEGKQKWSSPEIKGAYQIFLKMVSPDLLYGGANTALSTNFGKVGDPMFKNPPGCVFVQQATFIADFFRQSYPNLKAGEDFDFFGPPSINSQYDGNYNGFYDNLAMYNDTPAARKFMQYLSTAQAQQIWADDGGTLGAIKSLTYKDPIFKRAAETAANAKNLLVTAGDFMPSDMRKAYWQSLLNVTKDPSKLDSELAHLDQVQATAYQAA